MIKFSDGPHLKMYVSDIQEFYEATLLDQQLSTHEKTQATLKVAERYATTNGESAPVENGQAYEPPEEVREIWLFSCLKIGISNTMYVAYPASLYPICVRWEALDGPLQASLCLARQTQGRLTGQSTMYVSHAVYLMLNQKTSI